MNTEKEITLFHWNILELGDELEIFVGLRDKPDKYLRDTASDYLFRYSTPVESFDEVTGIGVTKSGRVYRCMGAPTDPHGEIRAIVGVILNGRNFRFRYDFREIQG